jgi:MFS family permease
VRALLAIRDARVYLIGQIFSSFGDTVMWLAMGIWVKTLTASNGAAGLVFFCFAAPQLFAPFSGLLVDRLPRRPLLIATNAVAGALVLTLFGVHGKGQVWLIYLVMVGYGAAYTVLSAGQAALLKELVPEELLGDANSLLRTAQEGFRLIGPLIGAGLFAAFGGATVAAVDAATFTIAAASLLFVGSHDVPEHPPRERWLVELSAGFAHIRVTPVLRRVIGACAVAFLALGVTESVIFAVVAGLHRAPTFISVIVVAQGVGAIVTGSLAGATMRLVGEIRLTGLGLALFGVGSALLAVTSVPLALAGGLVAGAGLPWLAIGPMTLVQRASPAHLVGRVSAATDVLIGTPQTVAIAVGAGLVTVVNYHLLLVLITLVLLGCGTYLLVRSSPRGAAAELERSTSLA